MSKYLGRDDILKVIDEKFQDVQVPEWGGTVRVRSLTGLQRSQLLKASADEAIEDWIERLCAACICDENGNPVFKSEDIKQLRNKNAAALNRVFTAADELNGISSKAIDELAGE